MKLWDKVEIKRDFFKSFKIFLAHASSFFPFGIVGVVVTDPDFYFI
jgi:hypothetical protein